MKSMFLAALLVSGVMAASPEVDAFLAQLQSQASMPFDAKRGEAVFTSSHTGKKGEAIACTTCHSVNLTQAGKNSNTGKAIDPLAPRANPARLTSVKEVQKWLRRNFKDVYNREGTAQEQGDVLTYIMNY